MAKKLTPLEAFDVNFRDAQILIGHAKALKNERRRGMRKEQRDQIGKMLRIPAKRRSELDRVQSDDLFVVIMPDSNLARDDFTDIQPLVRQSLVAGCAAFETYLHDKVMGFVGPLIREGNVTKRIRDINVSYGVLDDLTKKYKQPGRRFRAIIEEQVREGSSTAPGRVGKILSMIDLKGWSQKVDSQRGVSKGTTEKQLQDIAERRNQIAHSADRKGRGRASAAGEIIGEYLINIESIVNALENVLEEHRASLSSSKSPSKASVRTRS